MTKINPLRWSLQMQLCSKLDVSAWFFCGLVPSLLLLLLLLLCILQNISEADLFFCFDEESGTVLLSTRKSPTMKQIRRHSKEPEPQMASADNLQNKGAKFMRAPQKKAN